MKRKLKYLAMALGLSVALIGCSTDEAEQKLDEAEQKVEQSVEDLEEKAEDVKDSAKEKIADLEDVIVPTAEEDIYKPELLDRALEDLGLTAEDIILISEEYEVGDAYEAEFIHGDKKYEYKVDYSGQIVKAKEEVENDEYIVPDISFEEVVEKALEKADLTTMDLRKLSIDLEDAPENTIEIELKTEHDKFEYKVDPITGDIV